MNGVKTNNLYMKRNVSLIVLTCEIAAIVILHVMKASSGSAAGQQPELATRKVITPALPKTAYTLLTIQNK